LINLQNDAIEGFNTRIDEMEAAKNAKDEGRFDKAYSGYLEDYQRFTSTHAGALFMTWRNQRLQRIMALARKIA
jgi:hypothetical protein